jgi:hypothetical protein
VQAATADSISGNAADDGEVSGPQSKPVFERSSVGGLFPTLGFSSKFSNLVCPLQTAGVSRRGAAGIRRLIARPIAVVFCLLRTGHRGARVVHLPVHEVRGEGLLGRLFERRSIFQGSGLNNSAHDAASGRGMIADAPSTTRLRTSC